MSSKKFQFGQCSVPCGSRGPWTIDEFELDQDDAFWANAAHCQDGSFGLMYVQPGRYKRLRHEQRGVAMSNTRMERVTNWDAVDNAKGRVFIAGLGLGMVLEGILQRKDVTHVRVLEIDLDVIGLVGPHFSKDKRVEIVQGDVRSYRPAKNEHWDFVWFDIWDNISPDNLKEMGALSRKFSRNSSLRDCWSRNAAKRIQAYNRRQGWV